MPSKPKDLPEPETFSDLYQAMPVVLAGRDAVIVSSPGPRQIDLEELIADAVAGER